MKNKFLFPIILLSLVFCFVIFYKGLDYSNTYIPQKYVEKKIPFFIAKDLYSQTEINSEKIFDLKKNESTYIPLGEIHRLRNNTENSLEIIEVQLGDYLEEDDIVRYEDTYGRTSDD